MRRCRPRTRTSCPALNSSSFSNGFTGSPPVPPASSSKISDNPALQQETRLGNHMATETVAKPRTSVRVGVQKFGTFLSGMIMPNIGAFIAWGLITALFIEKGWIPVPGLGGFGETDGKPNVGLVGPMITYLLPLLIAYTGGRMVYNVRGGVIGSVMTMGIIVGAAGTPMFLGAMICGPLAAWILKQVDKIWAGRIKPGFEMLVDNFSSGILGFLLALGAFFGLSRVVQTFVDILGAGVQWLIDTQLLPLASIIVEPAKV